MSNNEDGQELGKQKNRFAKLTGSKLDEWETSDLINAVGADGKSFQFTNKDTEDFTELTPFDDYLRKEDPEKLEQITAEHEANRAANKRGIPNWHYSCQFCGHGIIDIFKIKNVARKTKAVIGSECIKGFENVDPANALFAKRDEKTLRDAMKKFIPIVSNQIWTDERLKLKFYYRDGVKKMLPKQKFRDYYNLLKAVDVDKISVATLKTIFKKIDKLEFIEYPEYVEDIVHPQLAKEKKKQGGLDGLFD